MTGDSTNGYTQPAIRTSDFLNSIGVNTHLDFTWTAYGNMQVDENALNYLGVKNVRDSIDNFTDLGAQGIWQQVANATGVKFDAYIGQKAYQASDDLTMIKQAAGQHLLNYIEGINEADDAYALSTGNSLQFAAQFQQQVSAAGQSLGIPVINMSFGQGWSTSSTGDYGTVGNLSAFSNYSNAHTYFPSGDAPGLIINSVDSAAKLSSNTPTITTEMGWYTNGSATSSGLVSETVQAKYTLDGLLDAYKAGNTKTYLYELLDQQTGSSDSESNFGLFHSDGTPKAAAVAIHNLTTLLADNNANAATFAPQSLAYSLSGLQNTDNSMLMEKSDGSYWLSIWNERSLTLPNGQDAVIPNHTVTLTLVSNTANITVYDPLTGLASVQAVNGARSVNISVPDHPVIVEINALQAAAAITPPAPSVVPVLTSGDIVLNAPATQSVLLNATQAVGVSVSDPWGQQVSGNMTGVITSNTGIITMTDGNGHALTGSGTHSITLAGTVDQINAELATLTYSAPSLAGNDSVRVDLWNQGGVHVTNTTAITDQSPYNSSDLVVNAPSSATVVINSTQHLTGFSLSDPWSKTVTGTLTGYIVSQTGPISMTDANGNPLAGSGTHTITLNGTADQLNAELATLSYQSPALAGSDSVRIDIWNQAGVHVTNTTVITDQSPYVSSDLALTAPATASALLNTTQALAGISISDPWSTTVAGTMTGSITVSAGTIAANDGSGNPVAGSGTHSMTLNGTLAQLNAELATLTYHAPGLVATDSVRVDLWNQAGVHVTKTILVSDQSASSNTDLSITAPASASVQINTSPALSGIALNDAWAQTVSGSMATIVSSTIGTIAMTDANGHAVAGSGSHSITLNGSLSQINAELATLSYSAPGIVSSDTVRIDAWNQSGVHAAQTIAIADVSPFNCNDLSVTAPATQTMPLGVSNAVSGVALNDAWAQTVSGTMAVIVSSSVGSIAMTDATGHTVPGSGSHSITLNGTFAQINAELATLAYQSPSIVSTDNIRVDAWNQAGIHAAQTIAVASQSPYSSSDLVVSAPATATANVGTSEQINGLGITDAWSHTVAGTMSTIVAASFGTIAMTDANGNPVAGSGSHSITLNGTADQLNAELATLTYQAPALTGADAIRMDTWNQAGFHAAQTVAVTNQTTASSHDLILYTPAAMTATTGSSQQLSGLSISDPWAHSNPGTMSTIVSSSLGTLFMTNANGSAAAGSGTHSITITGTLDQLNAELATLSYHAPSSAGSDVVRLDTWNQAGVHATGSLSIADQYAAADNHALTIVSHQNDYGYHA